MRLEMLRQFNVHYHQSPNSNGNGNSDPKIAALRQLLEGGGGAAGGAGGGGQSESALGIQNDAGMLC